jgi:hypothetical protein
MERLPSRLPPVVKKGTNSSSSGRHSEGLLPAISRPRRGSADSRPVEFAGADVAGAASVVALLELLLPDGQRVCGAEKVLRTAGRHARCSLRRCRCRFIVRLGRRPQPPVDNIRVAR